MSFMKILLQKEVQKLGDENAELRMLLNEGIGAHTNDKQMTGN